MRDDSTETSQPTAFEKHSLRARWILGGVAAALLIAIAATVVWLIPIWLSEPTERNEQQETVIDTTQDSESAEGGYVEFPTQEGVREQP